MSASPLIIPVARFFTVSGGAGLAGGKLYSYEAGTNTPKDTYTNASGDTSNTNPVILDPSGSAAVWLNGNYKLNLTDSNDVQQANYPVDNVSSSSGGSLSEFVITTGSANTYIANPSPALTTLTAGQRLAIQINVTNTGPSTINVSNLGAHSLVIPTSSALQGGNLVGGSIYEIFFDGTNWQVVNPSNVIGAYALTTGVANTYAISPAYAITQYVAGQYFDIKINVTNTGASTINVSGLGTKSIVTTTASALVGGELILNGVYRIVYDGTNFQIENLVYNPTGSRSILASNVSGTTDLGSIATHLADVTGTNTISSFGSNAILSNPLYFVRFTGVLTLTHNASSFILPGGANIVTAANDTSIWLYLGSGNWECVDYQKSNGSALKGIIQIQSVTKTTTFSTNSTSYTDVTGLSVSITPTLASSTILLLPFVNYSTTSTGGNIGAFRLMRDSTPIFVGASASNRIQATFAGGASVATSMLQASPLFLDSPATTSATTYKIQTRANNSAPNVFVNRSDTDADTSDYARGASSLYVIELGV